MDLSFLQHFHFLRPYWFIAFVLLILILRLFYKREDSLALWRNVMSDEMLKVLKDLVYKTQLMLEMQEKQFRLQEKQLDQQERILRLLNDQKVVDLDPLERLSDKIVDKVGDCIDELKDINSNTR